MIGSLGEIIFEVSQEKILTFSNLNFQEKANYAEHSIHAQKSILEFTGFNATNLSIDIVLNAALGLDPLKELEGLRDIFVNHEAVPFILDGKPQGDGLWIIESMNTNYDFIDNKGVPKIIEIALNLKEYIEINNINHDENFNNDYYGVGNW